MKKIIKFLSMNRDSKIHYLYGLLNKYKLLNCATITMNNVRTIVPIINRVGMENLFVDEAWMSNLISILCGQKTGAFIDIGVNLGQTLIKFKSLQIGQPYYGFEPNPNCFIYSKELVRINQYSNVEIFPVGLSDNNGVTSLFINSVTDSSGSIIRDFRDETQYSMQLRVLTLKADDILPKLLTGSVSAIKIDVEGAELEVIKGLANIIATHRPFIICEILPVYDDTTENGKFRKHRQEEVQSILEQNGYCIFRVMLENQIKKLPCFDIHAELALTNYVFAPEEATDALQRGFKREN